MLHHHPSLSSSQLHPPQDDRLVNISLQVDESHLVKHIQAVVQRSVLLLKTEFNELKLSLQKLIDEHYELRKQFGAVKDVEMKNLVAALVDCRTAVAETCAGAKALRKATAQRREREDALAASGELEPRYLFAKISAEVSGGEGMNGADSNQDGIDLESERIQALEDQSLALREQIRVLKEETTPGVLAKVDEVATHQSARLKELLTFLGLQVDPNYPGILHTVLTVRTSSYMQHLSEELEHVARRIANVEFDVSKKCDVAEVERVMFAVTDVRGSAEAAMHAVESERKDRSESVDRLSKDLHVELSNKVGWPDMERWKQSVNDVLAKTKESMQKHQRQMSDLQTDGDHVRRSVEDLNVRLAEFVLASAPAASRHTFGAGGTATAGGAADEGGSHHATKSTHPPNDFGHLLDGVDSSTRRKIQLATQAAYYAYADAPPTAVSSVVTTDAPGAGGLANTSTNASILSADKSTAAAVNTTGPSSSAKPSRPRSALLVRR